jgi:hypothetical protein
MCVLRVSNVSLYDFSIWIGNCFHSVIFFVFHFIYEYIVKYPLTLPEHPSSPPVLSGVRVTRSLVLYVCFVDRCLSFCTFSFGHCVVCSFLTDFVCLYTYEFWPSLCKIARSSVILLLPLIILLRYTYSDCPFGIFKLFYNNVKKWNSIA